MKNFIFILFYLILLNVSSQSTFNKIYYEPNLFHVGNCIIDYDTSLILSVWNRQQFPELILLKMDYEGNIVLEKNYGNSEDSLGWFHQDHESLQINEDGLLISGGSISKWENANYPLRYGHIALIDQNLDTLWTRTIREDYDSTAYWGNGTAFGSDVFLCGQRVFEPSVVNNPNGNTESFLAKYNIEGDLSWVNLYLENGFESFRDVEINNEKIYTLGSHTYPNPDYSTINKYNYLDGSELLTTTSNYYVSFGNTSKVKNDGLISFIPIEDDYIRFTKYDTSLTEQFSVEHLLTDGIQLHRDVEYDLSGNIIACGGGYDDEIGNFMGYIVKMDSMGTLIWNRRYFYVEDEIALQLLNSVIQTSDNGYAACGEINIGGGFDNQLWVIKTDSMGCIVLGCDSLDNSITNLEVNQQQQWFTFGPNPISSQDGLLNIYLGHQSQTGIKSRELTFKITNLQGQLVKEFEAKSFGVTYMIPLSGIAAGNYVLSLQNGHQILQSSKLIIE